MDDTKDDGSMLGRLIRNKWFQAASALGVFLGIIGFLLGLPPVADMAFGKRVSLTLDVVSQIPVFAVRQPVPGLSVQLNSQDLTQTRRDLVAVRLRLRNDGEVSINARNTTAKDPLGFSVKGGQVVRLYGLSTTSDHLRKLANPQRNGNIFTLPAGLIVDPGDFVQFDLLIVRPVNGNLSFISLGKVEGLKSIGVGRADMTPPAPNAAAVAWSGGFLPQLLRTLTYPFIAIALIAAIIFTGIAFSNFVAKRKRRKREAFVARSGARWDQSDPKLRKLVPAMYEGMGLHRLTGLIDTGARARRSARRAARQNRFHDAKAQPLSDFEAGDAIEKSLSESEVSPFAVYSLLERLSLRDTTTGKLDPDLVAAIEKYAATLAEVVPKTQLYRADPKTNADEPLYLIDDVPAAEGPCLPVGSSGEPPGD
ncbi:MAG: hypothetical protein ABI810_08335 [Sphingomonas bacterium]